MATALLKTFRQLSAAGIEDDEVFTFGTGDDATIGWDGSNLEVKPVTDNTGALNIGDGTTDMDLKVFMGSTSAYVLFDNDAQLVNVEGTDVLFGDADELQFGDGADVVIAWDADSLNILPVTDNVGTVEIGNGTKDIDLKVFLGTTSNYVLFDNSEATVTIAEAKIVQSMATTSTSALYASRWTALGRNGTSGDLVGLYGRAKSAATTAFAASATVAGVLAWCDLSGTFTVGNSNIYAGVRAIIETDGTDLSSMAAGGQSALFYGNHWNVASSVINAGIWIVNGPTGSPSMACILGASGVSAANSKFGRAFDFSDCTFVSSLARLPDDDVAAGLVSAATQGANIDGWIKLSIGAQTLYISCYDAVPA